MKIATFNVQNLFHRDVSLVEKSLGKTIGSWLEEFSSLLKKDFRNNREGGRLKELSFLLGMQEVVPNFYAVMRRRAGQLYLKKREFLWDSKDETTDWSGWIKLGNTALKEASTANKARIIREVSPEVLVLQEVEDKASVVDFCKTYLPDLHYQEVHLLQGNDPCGLEVALLLKKGYRLKAVRSHTENWKRNGEYLFDQDLQEFEILTPGGTSLWVLSVQLTGTTWEYEDSNYRRREQATQAAGIYENLKDQGCYEVVVTGSFNAPPYCNTLFPLLWQSDLQDITSHRSFRPLPDLKNPTTPMGTYGKGVSMEQNDYLLLSPALFERIQASGLNRKGVWASRSSRWPVYPEVRSPAHAASQHPMIWAQFPMD